MKIVTGAKACQFKNMCFRNYCKFSCTSSFVCPERPWERGWLRHTNVRARPFPVCDFYSSHDPANEKRETENNLLINILSATQKCNIRIRLTVRVMHLIYSSTTARECHISKVPEHCIIVQSLGFERQ